MDDSESNDLEREANDKYNESIKLEKELKQIDMKIQNLRKNQISNTLYHENFFKNYKKKLELKALQKIKR